MNDLAPRRAGNRLPVHSRPAAVTSLSRLVMDGLFCPNGRRGPAGRGSGHGSKYPSGSTDFWLVVLLTDQPANCTPRYLEKGPESISLSPAQRDPDSFQCGGLSFQFLKRSRKNCINQRPLSPALTLPHTLTLTHAPAWICTPMSTFSRTFSGRSSLCPTYIFPATNENHFPLKAFGTSRE